MASSKSGKILWPRGAWLTPQEIAAIKAWLSRPESEKRL